MLPHTCSGVAVITESGLRLRLSETQEQGPGLPEARGLGSDAGMASKLIKRRAGPSQQGISAY